MSPTRFPTCVLLAAVSLLAIAGCGPSREELGNIVYSVPEVPGADTPYELPDLGVVAAPQAAPEDADHEHAGHDHAPGEEH